MTPMLGSGLVGLVLASSVFADNSVHVGIHRHLHQPIYWGEPVPSRPNQSQFGRDSQDLKDANQAYYGDTIQHPENQLVGGNNSVFENPDKQQAYQNNIRNSIGAMNGADSGMTISFSGALQRNLWSFGRGFSNGYSPNWNSNNIIAYNWTTGGGNSRAEVLGQTYHHAFSPLLPKSVLRKQIEMHRQRTAKSWGPGADQSKGFWPIELAFSRHMIPILLEYNYEWVMVANSHLARTCPTYMDAISQPSPGAELKADPPNRADQLGPTVPLNQWYGANRDTFGNVFPVPFAYQAHRAQYIDPHTGAQQTIVAVPQCDYHGYQSGFGAVGWSFIDGTITTYNDPNQPSLVMLTNDGENFWGGGYSFWNEFAPRFMNDAPNHGKKATTIQDFLDDHPVPANDIIHVEDGSWLAADQGSPQFYRWLEPPRTIHPGDIDWSDATTIFDIEGGWHSDMRNWAVMMAGVNFCETAEQITEDGGNPVLAWRMEEPYQDNGTDNHPLPAESAWHFLMWGFDSGFVYFGDSLDDEVKHTVAANRAISIAQPIVGDASQDTTPPTVFKPQRFPWNPGGPGKGQYLGGLTTGGGTVGFTTPAWPSDFYIWTLAFDVSGLSNVTLNVRTDADGTNPLNDTANETYAGGAGVGNWVSIPMNLRVMPKDDPTNSSGLNFFVLPTHIADHYWAKVEGYRDVLLDYYIEATDNKGHVHQSEIQHVYVEDDCSGPYDPNICAVTATPIVAAPPASPQNNPGDNFDFDPLGGAATTSAQGGFGSFGQVYVNYDASHLYIGAHGTEMSGDNNAMVIFLGVDTLTNDKVNLWSNSGAPRGLDNLHNVALVNPMDLAILLGSETGDVTSATAPIANGFAFGQGVFSLDAAGFTPVAGAAISQFDGVDFFPTAAADDDGDARTDRWEAAIPWSALNAPGIESLDNLVVAGLVVSDGENGVDRYISSNFLGESATGTIDGVNNFGFNFVTLTGYDVCLPHGDGDGDGLANGFELRYWRNPGIAEPDDNQDGDVFSNLEEQALGTDPTSGASTFILFALDSDPAQTQITWTSVGGRTYAIDYTDDLDHIAFAEIVQRTETDVAYGVETTQAFVDDFTQTGGPPATGRRTYRVRLVTTP